MCYPFSHLFLLQSLLNSTYQRSHVSKYIIITWSVHRTWAVSMETTTYQSELINTNLRLLSVVPLQKINQHLPTNQNQEFNSIILTLTYPREDGNHFMQSYDHEERLRLRSRPSERKWDRLALCSRYFNTSKVAFKPSPFKNDRSVLLSQHDDYQMPENVKQLMAGVWVPAFSWLAEIHQQHERQGTMNRNWTAKGY